MSADSIPYFDNVNEGWLLFHILILRMKDGLPEWKREGKERVLFYRSIMGLETE